MNQLEYNAGQILDYLSKNQVVKVAVTVAIIMITILVVWLLLRNIRLWYWKTENIIKGLKEIDDKIGGIEDKIERINITTQNKEAAIQEVVNEQATELALESEMKEEPQPQLTQEEMKLIIEKEIDGRIRD